MTNVVIAGSGPFLLVVAALVFWRARNWKPAVALLLAGAIPVTLWIGRLDIVYGEAIPIRSYNGYNLLIGHNDAATGGYEGGEVVVEPPPCDTLAPQPATHINSTDRAFTRCALSWALHHPVTEVRLTVARGFKLFAPFTGPWRSDST